MSWTEQQTQIKQGAGESRLDKELAFLFGADRVQRSMQLDQADMWAEAESVEASARRLIERIGNPQAQRKVIDDMDDRCALALCKWIRGAE